MAWEWRENNREKVLEALRKGEYEAILTSREGGLDTLAHLACELEVLAPGRSPVDFPQHRYRNCPADFHLDRLQCGSNL